MSIAAVCNTGAWIACGVVAFLLFRDFLKTERSLKDQEENGKEARNRE